MGENFGKYLLLELMKIIEFVWKLIWSNKVILLIFWEFFFDYFNLLFVYFDFSKLFYFYLSKLVFFREGGNIIVYFGDREYKIEGIYEDEFVIY